MFTKLFAWIAGIIGGAKAAHAVDNSPQVAAFGSVILMGAQMAISTNKNFNAPEAAAINEALGGVAVASDPSTYADGLVAAVNSIPAVQANPTIGMLAEMAVETSLASYVAAHPNPVALVAPATVAPVTPTA